MKLFFEDKLKNKNIANRLRRAGYHFEREHDSGERSFSHAMGRGGFPRFHLYIREKSEGWELNLHLDQKQPSYRGTSAHAGEYDGPVVEREMERLRAIL